MTEAEAKTKWCPFVRVLHDDGRSNIDVVNRASGLNKASCIGSACMAWRGGESGAFKDSAEFAYRHRGERLQPTPDDIDGYCGLAGAPR